MSQLGRRATDPDGAHRTTSAHEPGSPADPRRARSTGNIDHTGKPHRTVSASESGREPRPQTWPSSRAVVTGVALAAALLVVSLYSAAAGQFDTNMSDVAASFWRGITGARLTDVAAADPELASQARLDSALWTVRFPRVVLAALVGAALGLAGTVMQGIFANPLADPSIVGVNAGASVAVSIMIVAGVSVAAPWAMPLAALVGSALVCFGVWAASRTGSGTAVLMLILTGIAINAVAVAINSFLLFLTGTASQQQIVLWQLGSVAGANWQRVLLVAIAFGVGLATSLPLRRRLDVLALGEATAASAGVNVGRLRITALAVVAVLTAAAVAFGGVIAFVGLIVPHALRLLLGPSHRFLVPLSVLGGALAVSLADLGARTTIEFLDLPIGVFTAVIGGPLFVVMLRHILRGYRMVA